MTPMDVQVIPLDWHRLFWGDTDWLFLLEVLIRTSILFGWLLLMMRWIGKRGIAQISLVELVFVMAIGSAAGDPMFYPEVPLIPALACITILTVLQRWTAQWIIQNESLETLLEGKPREIIRDGILKTTALKEAGLSKEDLFELLRVHNIRQLGQIQRAYHEQNGQVSVIRYEQLADSPVGLAIVPPWDIEMPDTYDGAMASADNPLVCMSCGALALQPMRHCTLCEEDCWTSACRDPLCVSPPAGATESDSP